FLPCGATEQHGPHLPLGTDALLASAISAEVAARVGGLVAPALSYGYKSQPKCGGGQHFCGTTSLDGATLSAWCATPCGSSTATACAAWCWCSAITRTNGS
ncbi:creatininase family protein, partial [Klebsiella pneumoniae]|uniref:creatininase family protein n=1 Tax=Klebsiella pneumoniae TaxID=573 RepID=UPI00210B4966